MENVWIFVLFGAAMGAGFYIGNELLDTIIEITLCIINKIVNKGDDEDEDEKWN